MRHSILQALGLAHSGTPEIRLQGCDGTVHAIGTVVFTPQCDGRSGFRPALRDDIRVDARCFHRLTID